MMRTVQAMRTASKPITTTIARPRNTLVGSIRCIVVFPAVRQHSASVSSTRLSRTEEEYLELRSRQIRACAGRSRRGRPTDLRAVVVGRTEALPARHASPAAQRPRRHRYLLQRVGLARPAHGRRAVLARRLARGLARLVRAE